MFASVEVQKKSRGKNNHVPVHTDVYTVLLPSSKMSKVSDPLRSILCTVDQKPLTWKDVLLHVVLIDEWVYECLELVIRYLYRSPFWNILKSTIICYMILLDWSFHFSVKYGYSRMEGDGKFCWWFLCCHCKKIRSDKREPCT